MQGEVFGGVCLSGCVLTQGGRNLQGTQSCRMVLHGVLCASSLRSHCLRSHWWEHQELAQPQLCVCCIPRLVPSWTSWSQMLTFLITGNCCVTLPEINRSTKQWLCTSKLCVCRRAEQWLLSQLLWAFRAVQFRFLFSQAGCALVLIVMDWQQHACFPVPLSWCPLAPSCPSLPGQVLHQDCYHGCDIYSRGGPGS